MATSTPTQHYLDPQTLATVGSLELRARMIVEGLMTGMHRSPHQGVSVEFAQHRPYTAGDDIRHMDWKVYGRTDKLYLKQYQKETNLDLVILIDTSGSMAYGSQLAKGRPSAGEKAGNWRKFDHAATIAAAMAYLSLRQQDRVGVIKFSDRSQTATRMSNSRDHWRAIADTLAAEDFDNRETDEAGQVADRGTNMSRMFDEVIAQLRQRSLIVLISDLFDDPESFDRGLARLKHRRHDLIVLQTLDAQELEFPFRAATDFVGLEGEGRLGVDPAALRKGYLKVLREHLDKIESATRRFKFDHLLLNTHESVGPPLSHFLARRTDVIARGK